MKAETIRTDITVIGGGLAGVCAAVAAARLGRTVALVQNRPVLVRDYRVEVCRGGEWTVLLRETDNRKRNRVHRLKQPVAAGLRTRTYSAEDARVGHPPSSPFCLPRRLDAIGDIRSA